MQRDLWIQRWEAERGSIYVQESHVMITHGILILLGSSTQHWFPDTFTIDPCMANFYLISYLQWCHRHLQNHHSNKSLDNNPHLTYGSSSLSQPPVSPTHSDYHSESCVSHSLSFLFLIKREDNVIYLKENIYIGIGLRTKYNIFLNIVIYLLENKK